MKKINYSATNMKGMYFINLPKNGEKCTVVIVTPEKKTDKVFFKKRLSRA